MRSNASSQEMRPKFPTPPADSFQGVFETFGPIDALAHGSSAQTGTNLVVAVRIVPQVVGFYPNNLPVAHMGPQKTETAAVDIAQIPKKTGPGLFP